MNKIEEFWYCVSPQDDLPLFKSELQDIKSSDKIMNFISSFKNLGNKLTEKQKIYNLIIENPNIISDIRVLVGISDKRLYLDLTYIVHIYSSKNGQRLVKESRNNLIKHDTKFFISLLSTDSTNREIVAKLITNYFINRGLLKILSALSTLNKFQIEQIFDKLIYPKEIQQMNAKYRGHGAEQAFAQIFTFFNLNIVPQNKDKDPMSGYDPNVDLNTMEIVKKDTSNKNCHSFDLIVKDKEKIKLLIQSLIHSSDPGQYGVNKSDETIEIYNILNTYNSENDDKVFLLGCVDGVGFCENPNGTIVKMIDAFDEFFQIKTLFKIPLFLQKIGLIKNLVGIKYDTTYFNQEIIDYFNKNYANPARVNDITNKDIDLNRIKYLNAGKALLIFK